MTSSRCGHVVREELFIRGELVRVSFAAEVMKHTDSAAMVRSLVPTPTVPGIYWVSLETLERIGQ